MSLCAAARFLRAAGPAAVPFRACCTAALITAGSKGIQCTAGDGVTEPEPVIAGLGTSVSADVPLVAPGTAAAGANLVAAATGSESVAADAGSARVAALAGRGNPGTGWPSP